MARSVAAAALGLFLAVGLASAPARADDPTPAPPTISIASYAKSLQPSYPHIAGAPSYEVIASVSSDPISNLHDVTMCMVNQAVVGDTWCDNAAAHPEAQFEMTWSQSNNRFVVTGQNHYKDTGSSTDYLDDPTATDMGITFKFQVSDAMLAGPWKVRITATDKVPQSGSAESPTTLATDWITVKWWGAVTTQRSPVDYGTIKGETSSIASGVSDGTVVTNGPSTLTLAATDFTRTGASLPLDTAGAPTQPPAPGKVAIDCMPGTKFVKDDPAVVRVPGPPGVQLQNNVTPTGTSEAGVTDLNNSCRLSYGGGASVTNKTYTNMVTVGIGAN